MSEFEFVIVLASFIVAFGVSELLSGWGRLFLNREHSKPYLLQVIASVALMGGLLQSLWGYWGFREVEWTFASFLLTLLPLFPLVGAAGIILPPSSGDQKILDPREHYDSVSNALFILLAAWVALGMIAELWIVRSGAHDGQILRVVAIGLLIGLSFTRNPIAHWLGLAVLVTVQVLFVQWVTPELG